MKVTARFVLVACLALTSGPVTLHASDPQDPGVQPRLTVPPTAPTDLTGLWLPAPAEGADRAPQADGAVPSVSPSSREASRTFFITYYQNAATPAHGWTGNRAACDAGATDPAFRDAVLLRINYFRAMAGVPAQVTFAGTYSAKAQQAALMMSVNNALNHAPPASWSCYTADGAQAAGSSNLALGNYGWSAMTAYMKDYGSGNGAVGHRRWILYPQTQNMGTGDVPPVGGSAANALWVFDTHMWEARPATREAFVAWPPPGYVPYQVVFPRWSFSFAGADFSQASVAMSQAGQAVPVALETVANGYGENTIAWIPNGMSSSGSWPQPPADTAYSVTISNAIVSGSARSFTYNVVVMDPAQATKPVPASDFTGDGTSDILWRGPAGDLWVWGVEGATHARDVYAGAVADANWEIRGRGDQNGDGTADLLWRNKITGTIYSWQMANGVRTAETYVATVPASYDIAGSGDFNGDGKSDILWRNTTAGDVWIWLMNGATPTSETYVDTVAPGYAVKGVGDLNGDTKADIVWAGAAGDVWVWLMNGTTRASQACVGTVPDTHYQIQQVADFDGNGRADLLWWSTVLGDVWIWPMNGASVVSVNYVGVAPDTNYRIAGAGDYDGDSKADILWRNIVQGDVWAWLMNGTVKESAVYLGTVPDQRYQIVK